MEGHDRQRYKAWHRMMMMMQVVQLKLRKQRIGEYTVFDIYYFGAWLLINRITP